MANRSRRHRRYLTEKREPLPSDAPEPKLKRINIRLSLHKDSERLLAQYLERDMAKGANISALIRRELLRFYKGIVPLGQAQQPEKVDRNEEASGPVPEEEAMDIARRLAGALDELNKQ